MEKLHLKEPYWKTSHKTKSLCETLRWAIEGMQLKESSSRHNLWVLTPRYFEGKQLSSSNAAKNIISSVSLLNLKYYFRGPN
jgi:hypothetical protein